MQINLLGYDVSQPNYIELNLQHLNEIDLNKWHKKPQLHVKIDHPRAKRLHMSIFYEMQYKCA